MQKEIGLRKRARDIAPGSFSTWGFSSRDFSSVGLVCAGPGGKEVSVKQIINGKMYNTETAKEIGCDSNGMNLDNFWFVEETLYQKQNGEFFLDGHGGPLSRYSRPNGCFSRCGARELVPLSIEEAKTWVERHCPIEDYIETFGNVTE